MEEGEKKRHYNESYFPQAGGRYVCVGVKIWTRGKEREIIMRVTSPR